MIINSIVVSQFQTNCYIIGFKEISRGIIIDPGDESEKILKLIEKNNFNINHILHTHGHIDHIGGTAKIKEITGARTFIHRDDLSLYKNLMIQGEAFGMILDEPPEIDEFFKDGDKINFNGIIIEIIHTPGHSPGSVCFKTENKLFSGDTLFNMGIGRTDLWGGSHHKIMKSINEKLLTLNDNTIVYPGHGPETTIGYEKVNNPYINL
ncbi:MAG: MBL fold metallo-hydrolase [Candidatus Helarchaeota archaeon]|nr:MBL fold metallo-hydrolase [Candidatus Helarchaeota archaeon]